MYSGSEKEDSTNPEGTEQKQRDHCFKNVAAFEWTPQSWHPALSLGVRAPGRYYPITGCFAVPGAAAARSQRTRIRVCFRQACSAQAQPWAQRSGEQRAAPRGERPPGAPVMCHTIANKWGNRCCLAICCSTLEDCGTGKSFVRSYNIIISTI